MFDIDPTLYDAALRNARAQFDAAASAAGTAADDLKAAADKLEEKRVALEDALGKYREAKDAQKEGEPPSQAATDALKAWHDAMQAYDDAEAEFDKAQDAKLTVTTPTVQLRAASPSSTRRRMIGCAPTSPPPAVAGSPTAICGPAPSCRPARRP